MLFLKCCLYLKHCDFCTGSSKVDIFKTYSFGREGITEKSSLRMLLIMLTLLDGPLMGQVISFSVVMIEVMLGEHQLYGHKIFFIISLYGYTLIQ